MRIPASSIRVRLWIERVERASDLVREREKERESRRKGGRKKRHVVGRWRAKERRERWRKESTQRLAGIGYKRVGRHVGATEVFYACQMRVLVSDLTLNSLHDPRGSAIRSLSSRGIESEPFALRIHPPRLCKRIVPCVYHVEMRLRRWNLIFIRPNHFGSLRNRLKRVARINGLLRSIITNTNELGFFGIQLSPSLPLQERVWSPHPRFWVTYEAILCKWNRARERWCWPYERSFRFARMPPCWIIRSAWFKPTGHPVTTIVRHRAICIIVAETAYSPRIFIVRATIRFCRRHERGYPNLLPTMPVYHDPSIARHSRQFVCFSATKYKFVRSSYRSFDPFIEVKTTSIKRVYS